MADAAPTPMGPTMPEWEVGRRGRERGFSYDVGNRAREREQEAKETPEQAATKRVEHLWRDADSVAQRAAKRAGIAWRKEWRLERDALRTKHQSLKEELKARAVDAEVSEQARARYAEASAKVETIGKELEDAKEPRPVPPVRDEVELEPSIIDRSAAPERLLAWVAGLSARERQAVVDRLGGVGGGSVDREDGFAVALANYFGDLGVRKAYEEWAKAAGVQAAPGLRARFLSMAKDPRHWVTREQTPGARAAGRPGGGVAPAPSSPHESDGPSGGAAPAPSSNSPTVAPSALASSPGVVSSSSSSAHAASQSGKQPAKADDLKAGDLKAGDLKEGGGLEWAGAGKAGRVFRHTTADTFIDSATRETVELETSWTMAEFDQFELKTNMVMEVERAIHIQLARGGVVIKSRACAFFNADQPLNDMHAALQAPARLVKHDGAIFVTDDKGMHLLRTLELVLPETPSVAGLLAHQPMLGFDIDPKQRIREADQFVTVTVPTYDRNIELVESIMRDAPHARRCQGGYVPRSQVEGGLWKVACWPGVVGRCRAGYRRPSHRGRSR
jgi:hypothetical protein